MKLKAQELRLGNWIDYFNEASDTWRQKQADLNDLECIERDTADHAQGIPLTEEWLIEFGFEFYSNTGYWLNYVLPNGWYLSQWLKDESVGGFEGKGTWYHGENYIPARYVHQLQNLYFALTGSELTIKE